ncbi:hypothetical protein BGZ63DRAFT_113843 [Mariannaea sp. PMI_226]|nr:hypothetical protein BGZ63DRAFT_113843 [Mariannaea sp. PMI_226]
MEGVENEAHHIVYSSINCASIRTITKHISARTTSNCIQRNEAKWHVQNRGECRVVSNQGRLHVKRPSSLALCVVGRFCHGLLFFVFLCCSHHRVEERGQSVNISCTIVAYRQHQQQQPQGWTYPDCSISRTGLRYSRKREEGGEEMRRLGMLKCPVRINQPGTQMFTCR